MFNNTNIIKVSDLIEKCFMCGEIMDKDNIHDVLNCDCGISIIINGCPECNSNTYINEHNIENCIECEFEDYTFCETIR